MRECSAQQFSQVPSQLMSERESGVLEAVGLNAAEERIYDVLLDCPGISLLELAETVDLPPRQSRRALASLQEKGLVSQSASKDPRFMPAPPDVAVEVLILQRQEQLERARLAAAGLVKRFRNSMERTSAMQLVEVVSGRDALAQRYTQLQQAATKEMIVFDKPPYASAIKGCDEETLAGLRRGLKYRAVYDRQALEHPGQPDAVLELVGAGEEARTLATLPVKLAIADRRLGLIPLSVSHAGAEGAVLLHASSLLDGLVMLFETLWERAVPIQSPIQSPDPGEDGPLNLSPVDDRILALLAAGVKDQAIARQLGVSISTLERRIKRIMDMLSVHTRYQAGLKVAELYREPRTKEPPPTALPHP